MIETIEPDIPIKVLFGNKQWCPICGHTRFTHELGTGIRCNKCHAKFTITPHEENSVHIICEWKDITSFKVTRSPLAVIQDVSEHNYDLQTGADWGWYVVFEDYRTHPPYIILSHGQRIGERTET